MRKCRLTITTVADGQENTIVRDGEMELSANATQICYREEHAVVSIRLQGESATVERQGDYSLRLQLHTGQTLKGEIGIGGSMGEIKTFTHAVQYSIREKSLMLSLKYDLLITGEVQAMQLRLLGRYKD